MAKAKPVAGLVPPALLANLVDPAVVPVAEERDGLERMLLREKLERDLRREILHSLDA